ncbi:hypothetical protein ABT232_25890 [Streptomyces sp. NPDC001532]|uniref:hypothetical protein n=1 Tax=Streptomyces sp. NPDC001532 TaxID=3154520 RepID=UPI00332B3F40
MAGARLQSCRPDEGRHEARTVLSDHGDRREFVAAANASWFGLAREHGLFGPEGEFLLGVPRADRPAEWCRVRLLDEWDLMGAGADAGLFGSAAEGPCFLASSPDGRVVTQTRAHPWGVLSVALARPWRAPTVRRYMEWVVELAFDPDIYDPDDWQPAAALAWERYLRHHTG